MRIGEFNQVVEDTFNLPEHVGILAVGPAGIGKTQTPMEVARRHKWDVEAMCMPLVNPTFLMGYPFRENGHADHAPFGALHRAMNSTRPTVLILDDLGGASGETCKAALRLLQFREVCGKQMPDHVKMIALTNDVGHGMEIQGLVEPMKDRFISIVNVEQHIDDTVAYGLARGWPADLLAYLRNDPKALHDMTPLKSMQRSGATPRGWEGMAKLARLGLLEKSYGNELAWGAVGKARATAYLAFRKLIGELPDIDGVIMDPEGSPIPSNPSARFLIAMALATKMNANTFGGCLRYLNRMPQMFRAFTIRDAIKGENARRANGEVIAKPIHMSGDFAAWSASEDGKETAAATSA